MLQTHFFADGDAGAAGMLILAGISFLLTARILLVAIFGISSGKPLIDKTCSLLGIVVVCALAAYEIRTLDRLRDSASRDWMTIAAIALAIGASTLNWQAAGLRLIAGKRRRIGMIGLLVLSTFATTALCSYRFLDGSTSVPDFPKPVNLELKDQDATSYVALTDRGNEIPLSQWIWTEKSRGAVSAAADAVEKPFVPHLIARGAPDLQSNCHGWVFTGGEFVIHSADVDRILVDNGYAAASEPRAGDLIIYRDSAGIPTHTGEVRGILNDGTVIIESKWGAGGRYLHPINQQPYTKNYKFYRSNRQGHRLTTRNVEQNLASPHVRDHKSDLGQRTLPHSDFGPQSRRVGANSTARML